MAYKKGNTNKKKLFDNIFEKFWRIGYLQIHKTKDKDLFMEIEPDSKELLKTLESYLSKNNINYTKSKFGNTVFVHGIK